MRYKLTFIFIITACIFLCACGKVDKKPKEEVYLNITTSEAKELMETETDYIILDVRTESEYADGHIEGTILIPDYDIEEKAEEILSDKDQLILVYCRSGRRSKTASEKLVKLGYTKIREFGGILDWPYGLTKN